MPERSDAVGRLIEAARLVDVGYENLSAKLHDAPADATGAPVIGLSVRLPDEQPDGDERRWQYGLRVDVATSRGTVVVEPIATYAVAAEHAELLRHPVLTEFANEVAVPALVPYARHALQDMAARVLREQIVMPAYAPGALTFPEPEA